MQATVTLKQGSDNAVIMQVSDKDIIKPTVDIKYPGRDVRAIVNYYDKGAIETPSGSTCSWRSAEISAMDTIRTKDPVLLALNNTGTEIYRSWANTIEDGYLTLVFVGKWGYPGTTHIMNLIYDEDTPYVYTLAHDLNGDSGLVRNGSGLIAFDLHGMLPETEGAKVVINYQGYCEAKSIYFILKDGAFYGPYSGNGAELTTSDEVTYKSTVR